MGGTEFRFTDSDFRFIADLIRERAGINLGPHKRAMVYTRLARRLRSLNLTSFKAYREIVSDPNSSELVDFVNALTTNLTRFFREGHHFEHLGATVLPECENRVQVGGRRRLRIWSAGCSSGEEPYSIGIVVQDWLKGRYGWDARILATDIDTNILARAKAGLYSDESVSTVPKAFHGKYFVKDSSTPGKPWRVHPQVHALVTFKQLNLLGAWPMKGPFDVIFCRNVLIYFDKPTQGVLINRFADLLVPNGYLYLGHSESIHRLTNRFEFVGRTIFRRTQ